MPSLWYTTIATFARPHQKNQPRREPIHRLQGTRSQPGSGNPYDTIIPAPTATTTGEYYSVPRAGNPPAAFETYSPPVGTDSPMAHAPKICNSESKQPSLQDSNHRGKTAENQKLKLVPRHDRFKTQPRTKTQKQAVNNTTSKTSPTSPSPPPTTPTVAVTPASPLPSHLSSYSPSNKTVESGTGSITEEVIIVAAHHKKIMSSERGRLDCSKRTFKFHL